MKNRIKAYSASLCSVRLRRSLAGTILILFLVVTLLPTGLHAQSRSRRTRGASSNPREQAGHLLRRIGFGPTAAEVERIVRLGTTRYIDEQLNPTSVVDPDLEERLAAIPNNQVTPEDTNPYMRRWYLRMVYSKRQLLEKMTLFWHEHFATSRDKGGMYTVYMETQENLFRQQALGSFRQLLIDVTKDPAMLIWLDNNNNNGRTTKPPNENYARELLQLFALGPFQQQMDGTPILDNSGAPVPSYTEEDVREVSRALTGWRISQVGVPNVIFDPNRHDTGNKVILGQTVRGRTGTDGAREVEDVIDILVAQPTMAPFISKILIQKFATETPTPGYVARVSAAFVQSRGDIKTVMSTLLKDPEFWSPQVIRSQIKTPIELYVGAIRALEGNTRGASLVTWTRETRHLIYYPPDVFSFYTPGRKDELLDTNLVITRDNRMDTLAQTNYSGTGNPPDTYIDINALASKYALTTPTAAVDKLSELLLQSKLETRARFHIINFFGGTVNNERLRTAIWLLLTSPDYQRN